MTDPSINMLLSGLQYLNWHWQKNDKQQKMTNNKKTTARMQWKQVDKKTKKTKTF